MKKIFLFTIVALILSPVAFCGAEERLSVEGCESWSSYMDNKNPETFAGIKFKPIKTLHEQQSNVTRWTNDSILKWSWEDIMEDELLDELDMWDTHERDYISAIKICEKVILKKQRAPKEIEPLLRKAELHIEQAIVELRKAHTKARMPPVPHGGILPGSTRKGEAADYVENKFIPKFVNGTLALLIVLSVLMLIIGGVMYLFASGDQELVDKAKTTITWAIVGTVITILSYAIVQFVIGIDFSL